MDLFVTLIRAIREIVEDMYPHDKQRCITFGEKADSVRESKWDEIDRSRLTERQREEDRDECGERPLKSMLHP